MRKIIYKAEFEHLCHVLDISDESKIELLGIFHNTPYDVKEYYELRPEYINYNVVKEKISSVCDGKDNDTIIKQIFTIGSDLDYIPDEILQEIKLKKLLFS